MKSGNWYWSFSLATNKIIFIFLSMISHCLFTLNSYVESVKPDVFVHSAAVVSYVECENNTSHARNVNISGTVNVKSIFRNQLDQKDRLVIMLFDKDLNRPVAIKILTNFNPPQKFSIGQSDAMQGQILKGEYSLRILTDKNEQPFQSVTGELIGRSKDLIPLGKQNLKFVLDQKYTR